MTAFGDALRSYRQASNDPDRLNRRLTQERLGELIGHEMGDMGVTGAAVSDWERGESRINAADRKVLLALIQVLHKTSAIRTAAEASRFLELGNYRALDEEEIGGIFGDRREEPGSGQEESSRLLLLAALFSISRGELESLSAGIEDGPSPTWPQVLAAILRRVSERFSFSLSTVLWLWVWLFAWWWIGSSLRLPFEDGDAASHAMGKYATGSILVPLLIGLLVKTKDNDYWAQQTQVNPFLLRLYTYQGAGIGFNVGYFFVFALVLLRAYLRYDASLLLELTAAGVGVLLGIMAARVVPYNLWRAYGRLTLRDGWIIFSVALLGPFWGAFFLYYHPLLLSPTWGTVVILIALTITVLVIRWQTGKSAHQYRST